MVGAVNAARAVAEKTLGFHIPEYVAEEVLAHTKRKCALNRKPDSYLPLLYENELTDYYMRLEINVRGGMVDVCNLRALPVRQQVS